MTDLIETVARAMYPNAWNLVDHETETNRDLAAFTREASMSHARTAIAVTLAELLNEAGEGAYLQNGETLADWLRFNLSATMETAR